MSTEGVTVMDAYFYSALSQLSSAHLQSTRQWGIDRNVPDIQELVNNKEMLNRPEADPQLFFQTWEVQRGLERSRYPLADYFRADIQCLYNYPRGQSFRAQLHVSFRAKGAEDQSKWTALVGIAFYWKSCLNQAYEEPERGDSMRGLLDYLSYADHIRQNPGGFDHVFAELGSDAEPEALRQPALARAVLSDVAYLRGNTAQPEDVQRGFRFFGRRFIFSNPKDRRILEDIPAFVREAIRIWDHIQRSPFGV